MKKAICVVLSILMLFTLQIPAMAQGASNRLEPINADTNSLICKAEDIPMRTIDVRAQQQRAVNLMDTALRIFGFLKVDLNDWDIVQ